MPEELLVLLEKRFAALDEQLDQEVAGTAEYKDVVTAYKAVGELIQADYTAGQQAIDLAERRKLQRKADRGRLFGDVMKGVAPPLIVSGASIFGSLMLLKVKVGCEEDGVYLDQYFKWAKDFILKLRS